MVDSSKQQYQQDMQQQRRSGRKQHRKLEMQYKACKIGPSISDKIKNRQAENHFKEEAESKEICLNAPVKLR